MFLAYIITILSIFISSCTAEYVIDYPSNGSNYPASTKISVKVSGYSASIVLFCHNSTGQEFGDTKTDVPAQTVVYFDLNDVYIGPCTITAIGTNQDQAAVDVSIVYGVVFHLPPPNSIENVNAGSSVQVQYTVVPQYNDPLTLNVMLYCSDEDLPPLSQQVPINNIFNYYIPIDYYFNCDFNISDPDQNFIRTNSPTIEVIEYPIIVSPLQNSKWFYPDPIFIRLNLRSTTSEVPFTGSLMCENVGADTVLGYYNSDVYKYEPINYVGNCQLAISAQDPSIQTVYINFVRYNDAKFEVAPNLLISTFPFNVMFTASPAAGYTLNLSCDLGISQSWQNLLPSTLYTFTIHQTTTVPVACSLSILNGAYPKKLPYITNVSLFGTEMYPITKQEQIQYAKSVAFPISL